MVKIKNIILTLGVFLICLLSVNAENIFTSGYLPTTWYYSDNAVGNANVTSYWYYLYDFNDTLISNGSYTDLSNSTHNLTEGNYTTKIVKTMEFNFSVSAPPVLDEVIDFGSLNFNDGNITTEINFTRFYNNTIAVITLENSSDVELKRTYISFDINGTYTMDYDALINDTYELNIWMYCCNGTHTGHWNRYIEVYN